MKVAVLSDGVAPYVVGGIQKYAAMLAVSLIREGVDVCLLHAVDRESEIKTAERLDGFPEDVRRRLRSIVVVRPRRGRFPGHYVLDSLRLSGKMLEAYQRAGFRADFIAAQGQTGRAFVRARS